jgi:hypothetical protein
MNSLLTFWLVAFSLLTRATSFSPSSARASSLARHSQYSPNSLLFLAQVDGDEDDSVEKKKIDHFDEITDTGDYKGTVDWDAEWKKVVSEKSQSVDRPGKDFYKTEAEIATIRAGNKAREQALKAASNIPSVQMPTWDSVKGDWKVSLEQCVERFKKSSCSYFHSSHK